jgi:hypothetical protein
MHKPRYLSDEEWSNAWGISWYSASKDDVTWVQHSGGLPGFESNVCFDRGSRVGAIALVNGGADAAELASFLVAPGFRQSGEPVVFQRRADGTVTSMLHGGGCLVRLDPVS